MKTISSNRAKACQIPTKVKKKVAERDSEDGYLQCVICGSNQGLPEAHYIPRSEGGLGIEENIFTACRECHREFDSGDWNTKQALREMVSEHFKKFYPDWSEEMLVYGNKISAKHR